MFERNRIERNGESDRTSYQVEVQLDDGGTLIGKIHVAVTRSLADELNNTGRFLDFELAGGERTYLAKHRVHQVRQLTVPRTDQLKRSIDQLEALDAAALLKVAPGSDREVLRDAYHRMIKIYHPDRFAGVELPQEVRDYLAAVARRLNIAHAMLQAGTRGEAKVAQPAE